MGVERFQFKIEKHSPFSCDSASRYSLGALGVLCGWGIFGLVIGGRLFLGCDPVTGADLCKASDYHPVFRAQALLDEPCSVLFGREAYRSPFYDLAVINY